jgi:RHS repeat-associated protein
MMAAYKYGPFGEDRGRQGPIEASRFPFRWSTKYADEETGLSYYGHRYYCAPWGRWLSRDPAEERGGLGLNVSFRNRPISLRDALGLLPIGFHRPEEPPLGESPDACRCNLDKFRLEYQSQPDGYNRGHRVVIFAFSVRAGSDPKKCALVQWYNGGGWDLDGTPRRITQYGIADRVYDTKGKWWVDSVDADPRYTAGLDYMSGPQGAAGGAGDEPGINTKGLFQVKYKMCIYHDEAVPKRVHIDANGGGYINTKAIRCLDWEASILWDDTGETHPAFWHAISGRH